MLKIRHCLLALIMTTCASLVYAEEAPATAFTLTTDAFLDTGALPVLYTCDGKDVSPQLEWSNAPAKAQSFAIVFSDPTAATGTFYHWMMLNIPKTTTSLEQGISKSPSGAMVMKNSFDKAGYNGPCPPKGTAHTYSMKIFALDSKLTVPANATAKDVEKLIAKHMVGKVELTTVYTRWLK